VNAGFEYREEIGPGAEGETVLGYLTRRYRHTSEADWRARIDAGEVLLDHAPAGATTRLVRGQSLVWKRPPWEEPDVPVAFAVLHSDADLVGVAKPRGLPTVPNGGFLENTLMTAVQRHFPEAVPVHRLGRGTSGIVLFATPRARRAVSEQWRDGRVSKQYLALVRGVPRARQFTIDTPIGPVPHPRLGNVYAASPTGKPAITHVQVLQIRDEHSLVAVRERSLVAVQIPTGRPHQIRIHLAVSGHPLVGDPLYDVGGIPKDRPGLPGDGGYRLHAHRLSLDHPTTGRRLELWCAPPPDLRERG
jgi:23S rRNA pseudouridine1911/1915/1917 synthase